MPSILRSWVTELPIRHQGVLIAAVRGCDGQPKNCSAKPIVRALRYTFLNPADEREVNQPNAFMVNAFDREDGRKFLRDWDQYPVHFVQHLMHAAQVVAHYHPDTGVRLLFDWIYCSMVSKLHLKPETKKEMDLRLTEDRIALYGNATGEV